jgi:hypothetical protein
MRACIFNVYRFESKKKISCVQVTIHIRLLVILMNVLCAPKKKVKMSNCPLFFINFNSFLFILLDNEDELWKENEDCFKNDFKRFEMNRENDFNFRVLSL